MANPVQCNSPLSTLVSPSSSNLHGGRGRLRPARRLIDVNQAEWVRNQHKPYIRPNRASISTSTFFSFRFEQAAGSSHPVARRGGNQLPGAFVFFSRYPRQEDRGGLFFSLLHPSTSLEVSSKQVFVNKGMNNCLRGVCFLWGESLPRVVTTASGERFCCLDRAVPDLSSLKCASLSPASDVIDGFLELMGDDALPPELVSYFETHCIGGERGRGSRRCRATPPFPVGRRNVGQRTRDTVSRAPSGVRLSRRETVQVQAGTPPSGNRYLS